MRNKSVTYVVQAAVIAALYVVLTLLANALGLSSYSIQVRFSEALCILPFFTPAAIPGLFVGCLIGNILGGAVLPDIIFGSLATLIGAVCTWKLRGQKHWIAALPPVVANICIVPFVLRYAYGVMLPIPLMMLTVGIGEVISCEVFGCILAAVLGKYSQRIWKPAV